MSNLPETRRSIPPLEDLGFDDRNLALVKSFTSERQGFVLVGGPAGSGRTSTLYSAFNLATSTGKTGVTLDEAVETAPQMKPADSDQQGGTTLAARLRAAIHQRAEVILIPRPMQRETVELAVIAAQTGHLLFGSLESTDAVNAIGHLVTLDIKASLIASSLVGVVAQCRVRSPCRSCAVRQPPRASLIESLGVHSRLPADGRWVTGAGCEQCNHSGYAGEIAIHEVLKVTDEIRSVISSPASEETIHAAARRAGMRTLLEDGVAKAARGLTTLDELMQVVPKSATMRVPLTSEPSTAAQPILGEPAMKAPSGSRQVLIVEDDPTTVSVVKYFLELEGYEVFVAADGVKGLEMALDRKPDVVISDINMPGLTGTEMMRALRSDSRTSRVRILMLTAEASVDSETSLLAAGADDYLVKPVEPRRLVARVGALLARANPRST
jgi:CheY-like chemotaxis protein